VFVIHPAGFSSVHYFINASLLVQLLAGKLIHLINFDWHGSQNVA